MLIVPANTYYGGSKKTENWTMVPSNQNACSSTIRSWFEHLVAVVVALVWARSSSPLPARGRGHPPVAAPLSTGCSSGETGCNSRPCWLQLFPSTRCRSPVCFFLRPAPTGGPSHGGVGEQEGEGRRAEVKRGAGMPRRWGPHRRNRGTGRR